MGQRSYVRKFESFTYLTQSDILPKVMPGQRSWVKDHMLESLKVLHILQTMFKILVPFGGQYGLKVLGQILKKTKKQHALLPHEN